MLNTRVSSSVYVTYLNWECSIMGKKKTIVACIKTGLEKL